MTETPNKDAKVYGKLLAEKWKNLQVPLVMSEEEVEIYKEFILKYSKGNEKKAFLFGATPQLRDLLYELGYDVTLLDINAEMVEAMSLLLEKSPNKEKKIIGNWLDLGKEGGEIKLGEEFKVEEKFDLVLGDHFLNHIPYKKYSWMFETINSMLNNDGLVVINAAVTKKREVTAEDVINFARKDLKSFSDLKNRLMWVYLLIGNDKRFFDDETKTADFNGFNRYLNELHKKGEITDEEFECIYMKETGDDALNVVMITEEEFLATVRPIFNILEQKHSQEHEIFSHHLIYAMKKKKKKKKKR